MKALVYTSPEQLAYRDEPDPTPDDDEVIIEVAAVGICGSDMHAYFGHDGRRPAPLILGHEATGLARTGRFAGRQVVVNPLVTCGRCEDCLGGRSNLCADRQIISMPPRPGAFAERIAIPESNLVAVPDGLPPEKAALAEPVATAYHAARVAEATLDRPLADARVLVAGAGAIGLSAGLVLRHKGAGEIVLADTNALRRETARDAEGFRVIDPLAEAPAENAFHLIIDAVGGRATREMASRAVRPGGTIVHVGLMDADEGLDIRKLTLQEVSFTGTYTYTMDDFRETVTLMADGRLGALTWTETRPLADGAAAFHDLGAGRVAAAKVILRPGAGKA